MNTRIQQKANAELAIAIMAEGGSINAAAEATNMWPTSVKRIRDGTSWPALSRPAKWPRGNPRKLTDDMALKIIERVANGEDRADVCLTCGADVDIATINNVVAGRTHKHLPRPERQEPAPKPPKALRGPADIRGSKNPNVQLTETDVRLIAQELAMGRGETRRGLKSLAIKFNVHFMTIRAIARGRTWGHITGILPVEELN